MSSLSEDTWCAGWMHNLEFDLWAAVQGERQGYGRASFSDAEIAKLKALSDACGGWIIFDDTTEQTFVTLPEWSRIFAEHESVREIAGHVDRTPRSE